MKITLRDVDEVKVIPTNCETMDVEVELSESNIDFYGVPRDAETVTMKDKFIVAIVPKLTLRKLVTIEDAEESLEEIMKFIDDIDDPTGTLSEVSARIQDALDEIVVYDGRTNHG